MISSPTTKAATTTAASRKRFGTAMTHAIATEPTTVVVPDGKLSTSA